MSELRAPRDACVEPEAVAKFLDGYPETELVALVHCETPAGTVHDLREICAVARERGVLTLADCVSSVGGMPVDMDQWGLDACVTAPHKCMGGVPGVSLAAVSDRAWAAVADNPRAPRDSGLSLLDWDQQWRLGGKFPHTPSVHDVYALEAACALLLAEGLEAAWARHAAAALACRAGARAMGLELWPASDRIASACVTAVRLPAGLDGQAVTDHARRQYGVMLSAGHGISGVVRVGHMGPTTRGLYPAVGLLALGLSLTDLGVPVRLGEGIEAATEALARGLLHEAAGAPG